jgi:hypothetical protein
MTEHVLLFMKKYHPVSFPKHVGRDGFALSDVALLSKPASCTPKYSSDVFSNDTALVFNLIRMDQ